MFGFKKCKDGGPDSNVWFYGFEFKKLFSVALLKFDNGSRDAYHSHAFNCVSLILGPGHLEEHFKPDSLAGIPVKIHQRGKVLITRREDFHQVFSFGTTWVLTLRGPWKDKWKEYTDKEGEYELTHGRERLE